jgi:hypothetical protein
MIPGNYISWQCSSYMDILERTSRVENMKEGRVQDQRCVCSRTFNAMIPNETSSIIPSAPSYGPSRGRKRSGSSEIIDDEEYMLLKQASWVDLDMNSLERFSFPDGEVAFLPDQPDGVNNPCRETGTSSPSFKSSPLRYSIPLDPLAESEENTSTRQASSNSSEDVDEGHASQQTELDSETRSNWDSIVTYFGKVLSEKNRYRSLLALRGSHAQSVIDLFQLVSCFFGTYFLSCDSARPRFLIHRPPT